MRRYWHTRADAWASKHPRQVLSLPCRVSRKSSSGAKQRMQPPGGCRSRSRCSPWRCSAPRWCWSSSPGSPDRRLRPQPRPRRPAHRHPARPCRRRCSEAEAIVNSLSTRDKLAQLLMVGVTGAEDARAVAADHHVGGIMIGSWTDLSMLQDGSLPGITAASGPLPLAVSVDEEGGRVQRLSPIIGSQPSPRILAATSSPEEVYSIALDRGRAMKALGITVDFAPVVDVTDAPDDTVIGDRSFGSNPETVTTYAGAYARGLRDAGVLPVLKHFPGHGHGSGDSHTGGVSTPPIDQLRADDLIPYRTLTTQRSRRRDARSPPGAGADGHRSRQPVQARLRPVAVRGLRRPAVHRPGVHRRPVQHGRDQPALQRAPKRCCARCRQAPTSRCGSPPTKCPAVLDSLEQAVNSGQLSMDRVNESATRVAASKEFDAELRGLGAGLPPFAASR